MVTTLTQVTASGQITTSPNRRVMTVVASAATALNVQICDGTDASRPLMSLRVIAGDSQEAQLNGVMFPHGIYVNFVTGTGEVSVEYTG